MYLTATNAELLPASTISVYPNPFMDNLIFNVSLPTPTAVSLKLMNSMGQVVFENSNLLLSQHQPYSLDFAILPTGMYWLRLELEEGVAIKKVIKWK